MKDVLLIVGLIVVAFAYGWYGTAINNWALARWPWRTYLVNLAVGWGSVAWWWLGDHNVWVALLFTVWVAAATWAGFGEVRKRSKTSIRRGEGNYRNQWTFSNRRAYLVLTRVDRLWEVEDSRVRLSGYGTFDTRITYHQHLRDALHLIASRLWSKETTNA